MDINTYKLNDGQDWVQFVKENKVTLMIDTINSIEYCLDNNLDRAETFILEGSDICFIVSEESFMKTLDKALNAMIKAELYDLCAKIVKLKERVSSMNE